jgi:hypothetical protein
LRDPRTVVPGMRGTPGHLRHGGEVH